MKVGVLVLLVAAVLAVGGYFGLSMVYKTDSVLSSDLLVKMKYAVTKDFLDPNSAQFRNVREDDMNLVCGEVNAKNAVGAYAGFSSFAYDAKTNHAIIANFILVSGNSSENKFSKLSDKITGFDDALTHCISASNVPQ